MDGDRYGILCPWHDEHTTGDGGTCVWVAEDGRYPGFNCLHAHCQGRTLRDLLESYGKEAVDRCCAEQFGDRSHDRDEAIEAAIPQATPPKPSGNGHAPPNAGGTSRWTARRKGSRRSRGNRKATEEVGRSSSRSGA